MGSNLDSLIDISNELKLRSKKGDQEATRRRNRNLVDMRKILVLN